eukprot:7409362-Pyramimonas_sp.AAC.1
MPGFSCPGLLTPLRRDFAGLAWTGVSFKPSAMLRRRPRCPRPRENPRESTARGPARSQARNVSP